MFSSRIIVRTTLPRAARSRQATLGRQSRFESTAGAQSASNGSSTSSLGVGVAGGIAGALALYGIHYMTPAGKTQRAINKAAKQANDTYQTAAKKLQETSPNADQAIDYIKQFAYSYVGWVPGGRAYVDTVFADIDTVRKNNGREADQLVNDAYKQLQDVAKAGLSLETMSKAYDVLADLSKKTANLAGNAVSDLLDNHPALKEKLGGNVDQLKQLAEQYGPDAEKQVNETWQQLKDVAAGGLSASNLDKARKLIDEKMQAIKKLGNEAWEKGLEGAKPLLDKNPKVKELVEKNADALKQGNAKELFERARSAIQSGDLSELEKYVTGAVDKAKKKGSEVASGWGNLDQYASMIPDGDQILPKLQQLREVAEKHKDEGQKLFNDTWEEVKQVIEKRSKEAEDIAGKAKKDAKKEAA